MLIRKNIDLLYFFGMLFSSFDKFLVINVGFSLRTSLLLFLFPIFYALFNLAIKKKIQKVVGFTFLFSWFLLILVFTPNTSFFVRSIVYSLFLAVNILLIFATVQNYDSYERIIKLFKAYMFTFVFIGIFGLIQFILPLLRITPPFVEQWWIPGVLARINAFSYEPSYFATYLLMGWSMSAYFNYIDSELFSKKFLRFIFWLLTVCILFSSSRIGWIIVSLWFFQYPFGLLYDLFYLKISPKKLKMMFVFSIILTLSFFAILFSGFDEWSIFLAGTGLDGSSSHSVDERSNGFYDTLKVFYESPVIGYSLGGVAPAIASSYGVSVTDNSTAQMFEGLNIFAEVLAASGIIGFIPFSLYFFSLFKNSISLLNNSQLLRPLLREILAALILSLLVELLALQFNQNILRLYLWVHISILSAAFAVTLKDLKESHIQQSGI